MPYPNNHACVINASVKVKGSMTREHAGKKYTVRVGEGGERSYLYPKDAWGEAAARAHCKAHGGTFEPASAKVEETELPDHLIPALNPMIKLGEE